LIGAVIAAPVTATSTQNVIVLLRSGASAAPDPLRVPATGATDAVASVLGANDETRSIKPTHVYRSALSGFAANLTSDQAQALSTDPRVAAIVPDQLTHVADGTVEETTDANAVSHQPSADPSSRPSSSPAASPSPTASPRPSPTPTGSPKPTPFPTPGPNFQIVPTGIKRVNRPDLAGAKLSGQGDAAAIDIAIVDTGVSNHPDLNVVGGKDCTGSRIGYSDAEGHGTHVSGTAAAKDNGFGVVGVAPGARIWSVKVLNKYGTGRVSWLLCGIDWIAAQRAGDKPLIKVANMSLIFSGVGRQADDHNCGLTNHDAVHQAICNATALGTIFVVAAGNYNRNAAHYRPASYDEVITVSALSDFDGKPGGLGIHSLSCPAGFSGDRDDVLAAFSDWGPDIDIMAPGKCIWSTYLDGRYRAMSGTSMATPHVTGAVALYLIAHPDWTYDQVKSALIACGTHDWRLKSDRDRWHEPLLDVARLC
jgi:subtilisin family serine protease